MKGQIILNIIFLWLFACTFTVKASNNPNDSLLVRQNVDALNEQAYTFRKKDPARMKRLADSALEQSRLFKYPEGLIDGYLNLASYYSIKGDFKNAIRYLRNAQENAEYIIDLSERKIKIFKAYGTVYLNRGNYTESMQYYMKALRYAREANDSLHIAYMYNNLGILYQRLGSNREAMELFKRSLKIKESNCGALDLASTYNNIGDVYADLEHSDKAEEYYFKSYEHYAREENHLGMGFSKVRLGILYFNNQRYEKAHNILLEAKKIFNESDALYALSITELQLARINVKLDNHNAAKAYFSSAIDFFKNHGISRDLADAYHYKALWLYDAKNYEESSTVFQEYVVLQDSLESLKYENSILDLHNVYGINKLDEEINKQTKALTEKNTELATYKIRLFFLTFLIIISLLLIIFLIRFYIKNRRFTRLIADQRKEILQKNSQLEMQKKELMEINESKDRFFSIISHDIKNPFNALLGYSELLNKSYENLNSEKRKFYITKVYKSAKLIFRLFENILLWSKSQSGKLNVEFDVVDVNKAIANSISILSEYAESKDIKIHFNPAENSKVYADANMLDTIIRNLLSNSIKFSFKNSSVHIASEFKDGYVIICIADQGMGMDNDEKEKLFQPGITRSKPGSEGEAGSGLGLVIVRDFVLKNKGELLLESTLNAGTSFYVKLHRA